MRLFTGLLLVSMLTAYTGKAQYIPNSGQAFQFASLYNPSFTGVESFGDLKLGYRYQWTGFKDNAPKFINLSYNVRLKQPVDLNVNALRTSQGKRSSVPKRKQIIQGLGVNMFNEQIGLIDRLGGGLTYAVHYPVSKSVRLAGGTTVMVENTRVDVSKIYLGSDADPDPFYDNLMRGGSNHTQANVRAGLLLYSEKFYIGGAYYPIWKTDVKSSDLSFEDSYYRASAQAGLAFPMRQGVAIKPSVLALLQTNDKILIDYSVKMYFQQKLWAGLTYRDIQSGIAMAGLMINNMFSASYAYEFSTGKMRQFSSGSHELVLSVRVNNFKRQNPQTW